MRFQTLTTLTLLPAAALAAPAPLDAEPAAAALAPNNVHIVGGSLLGSGCPSGPVDIRCDGSKTRLEIVFPEFSVKTGSGTQASDWRKNCKLTLNMEFDAGFQVSTRTTSLRGYAQLPSGASGQCSSTFDFTGASGSSTYTTDLDGPRQGSFEVTASANAQRWSSCGGTTAIMNVNTQCSISPTSQNAQITIGHSSRPVVVAIEWRRC
ncbi:secreted protein [Podospora australis]|uniref:Secreted protein n=1 Tax=Podospora australis TaxID=1536484 RepID=A0AAN6WN60_9PEZI|nr:secreted protein [Podospora australis]